jgi:hypothetical protein
MSMLRALAQPKVLPALTGLNPAEFAALAESFGKAWDNHTRRTCAGQPRQRARGAGTKAVLATTEQRLLFILFYFRHYPIQEVQGFCFGLTQPQANRWGLRLAPVLEKALGRQLALPARHPRQLAELLAACPELGAVIDGTERPIRRPKNKGRQRRHYSGKKKRHTVKNVVVTQARRVQFLSRTAPGRRHDKHLAEPISDLPAGALVLGDSGFQGWQPAGARVILPAKKPRGGELHPATVATNHALASCRVVVEHALAGVKRCRIVSDVFRHLKPRFTDLVMTIACGLHNFRTAARATA